MRTLCLILPMLGATALAAPKLKDTLPLGPVLSPTQRASFEHPGPSGAHYTGAPKVSFPVLPLQIFGLRYGVDIVLVSTHPDWDMHEYARIDLPDRPSIWVAKDATIQREQSIVSDLPDLETWVPEVPIPRHQRPLTVEDHSQGDHLDVAFSYTNAAGQPERATYVGPRATRPMGRRNGNSMGHSRNLGAIVLDLAAFHHGGAASVEIDGKVWPLDRLLGIYPQKFTLQQVQGGVVITRFRQVATAAGFELLRPGDDTPWPTHATEYWTVSAPDAEGVVAARRDDGYTRLTYRYRDGELISAEGRQEGIAGTVFELHLAPALPDLRRPFEGTLESRFVMDIGDQKSHGTGVIRTHWEGDTPMIEVLPTDPPDLATRPMRGGVRYLPDGSAAVVMEREPMVAPKRP